MTETDPDKIPPHVDDVNVAETDLAAEPETWVDRVKHYNKAIAAFVGTGIALGVKIATGEDVDPEALDAVELLLGMAIVGGIVWRVPNR